MSTYTWWFAVFLFLNLVLILVLEAKSLILVWLRVLGIKLG